MLKIIILYLLPYGFVGGDMRACFRAFCALLLATHLASPALAKRSSEALEPKLSGDQWAECFAVFTGMATILLAQAGALPAQGVQDQGARDQAAASGQGPADHFLALSEEAALRWLEGQAAGQDKANLMTGLERAVDQAVRTAAARSDFTAYLQRTSDRCIAAVKD